MNIYFGIQVIMSASIKKSLSVFFTGSNTIGGKTYHGSSLILINTKTKHKLIHIEKTIFNYQFFKTSLNETDVWVD